MLLYIFCIFVCGFARRPWPEVNAVCGAMAWKSLGPAAICFKRWRLKAAHAVLSIFQRVRPQSQNSGHVTRRHQPVRARHRGCVCRAPSASLCCSVSARAEQQQTAEPDDFTDAEKGSLARSLSMELSAAGDRIFAAEAILKRRVRKVSLRRRLALQMLAAVGTARNGTAQIHRLRVLIHLYGGPVVNEYLWIDSQR